MRSRLTILNLILLLCVQAPAPADIQGPSLASGAIIEISGGMPSEQEIRRYKRKHGSKPEPRSLRLEVRSVQPLDGCEYYLDDCGLKPVTLDGETTVTYFGYFAPPSGGAQLTFNVEREVEGKTLTFCFCLRESSKESACRGAGVAASIIWDSREGNVYRGRIKGVLFHPGMRDNILSFQWKPITLTVPGPGESLPMKDLPAENSSSSASSSASSPPSASSSSADSGSSSQSDEQPTPVSPAATGVTLSEDLAREAVGRRLKITVQKPVDTELMQSFYAEKVYRLASGSMISRDEIIRLTSKVVGNWSRRGIKLLEAGYSGPSLEMIVQYQFSHPDGRENNSFAKIRLDFDAQGKVCGMSEQFANDRPSLSPGVKPLDYRGEKNITSVD